MTPCFSRSLRSRRSMSATSGRPLSVRASAALTAQPRRAISSCARPTRMLAGTATSIIFGLGRLRLFINSTYCSTDFTCRRGLNIFSSDGRDRFALVVVGRENHGLVGQTQQLVEDRIVLRARVAVLEIGAAGAADEQR